MVRKKNQAARVWEGQSWLQELGYKDADDLMAGLTRLLNLPGRIEHFQNYTKIKPGDIGEASRAAIEYYQNWPGFISYRVEDTVAFRGDPEYAERMLVWHILSLRDKLRIVWSGKDADGRILGELFSNKEPDEVDFDKEGGVTGINPGFMYAAIPDWQRREFVYAPETSLQAACYLSLKNSHLAKVCANPECRSGRRYFIARKAQQRYCSKECFAPIQAQHSLDWWNREGKQRRDERRRQQQVSQKRGKH